MANYEEEVRRRMEQAAAECPIEEPVDAALGFREYKKELRKEMPKSYNKRVAIKKGETSRKIGGKGIAVEAKKKHGM